MEEIKKNQPVNPSAENQIGMENNKNAAAHFEATAKSHKEAAKHHENGDTDKAANSVIEARSHCNVANEAQKSC